jgi:cyanophycin synthetase
MPTTGIPITFKGQARFNVSNAQHAIAACYLTGIDLEVIRAAMGTFHAGYDSTPGRMNIFDELPFRVIMDFAHNPAGYSKLCEFVDQQIVPGRKVVAFGGTGTRPDETLKKMAASLAGHFDFYFCREHVRRGKDGEKRRRPVAHIMHQGLLEAGISDEQITVLTKGKDVVFEIFDACAPGDLLVMLTSYVEMHLLPGYISEYADRHST